MWRPDPKGASAEQPRPDRDRLQPMETPTPAGPRLAARHEPERTRFVVTLPDGEAELVYAPFSDDVIDLQHTAVPDSAQGHGVGDLLVRAALDYARSQRLKVIATCPYVQSWLRRHPGERP
jgi:predicted GNAT family acetyltransferase